VRSSGFNAREIAMKKIALPLFAVLMAAGSSPSWAWSDVTGTVIAVMPSYKLIELDNKQTYTLMDGVSVSGIRVGQKVTLTTEIRESKNVVSKLIKSS
jgi:hypothetical protein